MFNNSISLKFNTSQFPKLFFISNEEICTLTQSSIKDLAENNLREGFPHVLALVKDTGNGKSIFDGMSLYNYMIPGELWKWKNPNTNLPITRIYYFSISKFEEGYQLIKKINIEKDTNAQTFIDFWQCNNMVFGTDSSNPYAFYGLQATSMCSMTPIEKSFWYELTIKSISKHYGEGVAIFLRYLVYAEPTSFWAKSFLFSTFNYKEFDRLFINSDLHKFIQTNQMALSKGEMLDQLKEVLTKQLNQIENTLAGKIAQEIFNFGDTGLLTWSSVENLTKDDSPSSDIAKAILWTLSIDYKNQFKGLANKYPKWELGQAYLQCQAIQGLISIQELISREVTTNLDTSFLQQIAKETHDFLVLELCAELYEQNHLRSTHSWKTSSAFLMKALSISQDLQEPAVDFAVETYSENAELALDLLERNHKKFGTFKSLLFLSIYQRRWGIKKKDKKTYDQGVANGATVFLNSGKHSLLSFSLGQHLLAEFTPFPSNSEQIVRGVASLEHAIKMADSHAPSVKVLSDYKIRKGTSSEALLAHEQVTELIQKFPKDLELTCYSIRYHLRTAKKADDLALIETKLNTLKEFNSTPLISLIKGLWICHPLRRENQPDWFILASALLKEAFQDADTSHIQFLLDNLDRFDKLDHEKQTKCKLMIGDLLGYTSNI